MLHPNSNLLNELYQTEYTTEPTVSLNIKQQSNWQSRYRNLMLIGKSLPLMPQELQVDQALVEGCESKVWLYGRWQDNTLMFFASSDSKIVRGLITLILLKLNGKTAEQISAVNIEAYFNELGLWPHLSESRTNGLLSIVKTIQASAQFHLKS